MDRKKLSVMFLLLAVVASGRCAPAQKEEDKTASPDDVVVVPLEQQRPEFISGLNPSEFGDQPIVDTGYFSGPFSFSPFGLFQSLESMMLRMRQQLNQVLGRLPGNANSTEIEGLPELPFGNIDLSKANTTSTVKIIDGHKVVINETEYKQDGIGGGAIVKVRVVDIRPDSSEVGNPDAEPIATSAPNKEVESVEDESANEIPKTKEIEGGRYDNLETFDEVDSQPSLLAYKLPEDGSPESFENNNIENVPVQKPVDLSRDIYVNQLMADAGAPIDPDAEVFDPVEAQIGDKYSPYSKFDRTFYPR